MKSTATKITSVVLAASMALSFAACSKSGKSGVSGDDREASHSGEKISASTPWFNSKITTFKPDIDDSKPLEYCYSNLSGVDDDYLVSQFSTERHMRQLTLSILQKVLPQTAMSIP